jgi:branched-chain amino acid transport system ATP-binding protein
MTADTSQTGTRNGNETVLEGRGVTMQFGGLTALKDVSLRLHAGEIVGLIGPNGAGKTTFFNCLTGLYTPTSGVVLLRGKRLPSDPAKVTGAGVARTFQNIRLFPNMTVLENVLVGRHARTRQGPIASLLHGPSFRRGEADARRHSRELLDFVGLSKKENEVARNLPYGDQRRLEIARALATEPKVLLLDEPTAGMNPQETDATRELIFHIRDTGVSTVVIEHDTKFIFSLCDHVSVLVQGELLVEGTPETVREDPRVIEAYLGKPPEEVEAEVRGYAAEHGGERITGRHREDGT